MWFNLSYSISVTTRVAQSFLHLDIHFPKNHTFNKIFNKNNVKMSYSCMQNIKAIINNHNINILHQNKEIKNKCNCRSKYCSLGGKRLSPNTVYQGKITSNQLNYKDKVYFGVTEKLILQPHQILYPWRLRKWHRAFKRILKNYK